METIQQLKTRKHPCFYLVVQQMFKFSKMGIDKVFPLLYNKNDKNPLQCQQALIEKLNILEKNDGYFKNRRKIQKTSKKTIKTRPENMQK